MDHLIGQKLGQYEIQEKIGQGGMATVFKADQPALGRFVAIKVLSPQLSQQPGFTERFQREARAVARLNHPNILQVYDFGVQDGYNYIVMRYVPDSITLSDLMRQEPPLETLITYISQVADALHYAHEQGIIHRDIKPGNVLIDGKWALLADFGLVKQTDSDTQLTGAGVGMGTPAYISPEQARGVQVDHRTDIYALGIILYKILTGAIPHDAPTPIAIMARRIIEPALPPHKIKPDVPPSLESVVLRALALKPDDRYGSALHFAEAVQKAYRDPHYREEITVTPEEEPTVLGARTPTDMMGLPAEKAETIPGESKPMATRNKMTLFIGGGLATVTLVAALFFGWPALSGSSLPPEMTPTSQPATSAVESHDSGPASPTSNPTATPTAPIVITLPAPPGTPQAKTKVELQAWSGPGEHYEPLPARLPPGYTAEIIGRDQNGEWWQVRLPTGSGWIKAGDEFVSVAGAANVLIAMAPPTLTPTVSSTSTQAPATATPAATRTPTPAQGVTATATSAPPTATPTSTLSAGRFALLAPSSLDTPTFGPTTFEWQWSSLLAENQGFEVRVWLDGEPAYGVHDAVNDNKNGLIQTAGANTYRLEVDISQATGVQNRRGEYNWSVALVQIAPEYRDLGIQAAPGRLRFEPPGGGSDGSGGNSSGSGSGGGGLTGGD